MLFLEKIEQKKIYIISVIVICMLIGILYAVFFMPTKYTVSISMLLMETETDENNETMNIGTKELTDSLCATFEELVKSETILNEVKINLGLDESIKSSNVSLKRISNSDTFQISLKGNNQDVSKSVLTEMTNILSETINTMYKDTGIYIVDGAHLSNSSKTASIVFFAAIGILLGIIINLIYIFVLMQIEKNIKNSNDVENYFSIKTLGSIPNIKGRNKSAIISIDEKTNLSKAYDNLRTNIQFINVNNKLKNIILVTSPEDKEGKSYVSANLAISYASVGKKVILIDSDLNFGIQNKIFNIPNNMGLSNYLSNLDEKGVELNQRINAFINETSIKNLNLITSGTVPPNSSELLSSQRFADVLKDLSVFYDVIIIDNVSILNKIDGLIVSRLATSTVIVTIAKKTKKDDLWKAKKDVQNVGGNIIGVVLNRVNIKDENEKIINKIKNLKSNIKTYFETAKEKRKQKLLEEAEIKIENEEKEQILDVVTEKENEKENYNVLEENSRKMEGKKNVTYFEEESSIRLPEVDIDENDIVKEEKISFLDKFKFLNKLVSKNDSNDVSEDDNVNKEEDLKEQEKNENEILNGDVDEYKAYDYKLTRYNDNNVNTVEKNVNINAEESKTDYSDELIEESSEKENIEENNNNNNIDNELEPSNVETYEPKHETEKENVTYYNEESSVKVEEKEIPIIDFREEPIKDTREDSIESLNEIKQGEVEKKALNDTLTNLKKKVKKGFRKSKIRIARTSRNINKGINEKVNQIKENRLEKKNKEQNENEKYAIEPKENVILTIVDPQNEVCRAFSKDCYTEKPIRGLDTSDGFIKAHYSSYLIKKRIEALMLMYSITKEQASRIDPLIYVTLLEYDDNIWIDKKMTSNKAEAYVKCMSKEIEKLKDESKSEYIKRCQVLRQLSLYEYEIEVEYNLDSMWKNNKLKFSDKVNISRYAKIYGKNIIKKITANSSDSNYSSNYSEDDLSSGDTDNKNDSNSNDNKNINYQVDESRKYEIESKSQEFKENNSQNSNLFQYKEENNNDNFEQISIKTEQEIEEENYIKMLEEKKAEEELMRQEKKKEAEIFRKIQKEKNSKRKKEKREKRQKEREKRAKERDELRKERELEKERKLEEARIEEELLGDNLYPKTKNNKNL